MHLRTPGMRANGPEKWRRRPRWPRCWRGAGGWAGAAARWNGAPRVPAAAPQRGGAGGGGEGEGASVARFRGSIRRRALDFPGALRRLCSATASRRLPWHLLEGRDHESAWFAGLRGGRSTGAPGWWCHEALWCVIEGLRRAAVCGGEQLGLRSSLRRTSGKDSAQKETASGELGLDFL
jgi:hypothetical protein